MLSQPSMEWDRTNLGMSANGIANNYHILPNYWADEQVKDHEKLVDQIPQGDKTFYLFSHGRPGELLIAGQWLSPYAIAELLSEKISFIGYEQLAIYGCEFAKGQKGKQAVSYLETVLGVSIAASDDITGKNGNWELEVGGSSLRIDFSTYPHSLFNINEDSLCKASEFVADNEVGEFEVYEKNPLKEESVYGVTHNSNITACTSNVTDNFSAGDYSSGTGTWASNWIEVQNGSSSSDPDGPGAGYIQVFSGLMYLNGLAGTNPYIMRTIDLDGAISATLTFDLSSTGDLEESGSIDEFEVQVSSNGGSSWTSLETFQGDSDNGTKIYDISAYASSTTTIRFNVVANVTHPESFAIDNIDITANCIDPCDAAASGNADSDGDNVSDICDLDDDNDGILDSDEGYLGTLTLMDLSTVETNGANYPYMYPLTPSGPSSLPSGGVTISTNAPGGPFKRYTPSAAAGKSFLYDGILYSLDGAGSYLDIDDPVDRTLTIDFGTTATAMTSGNSTYEFVVGVAGLGGNVSPPEDGTITSSVTLTKLGDMDVFSTGAIASLDGNPNPLPGQTGTVIRTPSPSESSGYTFFRLPSNISTAQFAIDDLDAGSTESFGIIMGVVEKTFVDTDNDGIANHLDLDSDADGCSDAIESGATTDGSYNYQFADVDSNNDGLVDAVDDGANSGTVNDGTPDYTATLAQVIDEVAACDCPYSSGIDSDGDGIDDTCDLDDDNDGIPDLAEGCVLAGIIPSSSPDGVIDVSPPAGAWEVLFYGGHFGVQNANNPNDRISKDENNANYGTPILYGEGYTTFGSPTYTFDDPDIKNTIPEDPIASIIASGVDFYTDPSYVPKTSGTYSIIYKRTMAAGGNLVIGEPGGYFDDFAELFVNGILVESIDQFTPSLPAADVITYTVTAGDEIEIRLTNGASLGGFTVTFYSSFEEDFDTDGDGIPNCSDLDSDNDGIPDLIEAGGVDTDGNGRVDDATDTDGDGLANSFETADGSTSNLLDTNGDGTNNVDGDTDGDGLANWIDLDADGDGILDIIEAGGTDSNGDGVGDTPTDADDDGYFDIYDPNASDGPGGNGSNGTAFMTVSGDGGDSDSRPEYSDGGGTADTDGDDVPNFLDVDSDNDGIFDIYESQASAGYTPPSGSDDDSDGIDNVFDDDDVNFGGAGAAGTTPVNTDSGSGDTNPDYLDSDSDGDEVPDMQEAWDSLTDGDSQPDGVSGSCDTDADGDGYVDCFDSNDSDKSVWTTSITPPSDDGSGGLTVSLGIDIAASNNIDDIFPTNNINGGGDNTQPDFRDTDNRDCAAALVWYAITEGDTTNDYHWVSGGSTHTKGANTGIVRATAFCDKSGWYRFYNPLQPNKYIFSIQNGTNTEPLENVIDYVEIKTVPNPVRNQDGSEGMILMRRAWFIGTKGNLNGTVNIRFYFPKTEWDALQDSAIALASDLGGETAYTWYKTDTGVDYNSVPTKFSNLASNFVELTSSISSENAVNGDTDAGGDNKNYVQIDGLSSFSGGTFGSESSTPLPVEWLDFTIKREGSQALIQWQTAQESNSDKFIIERSVDREMFLSLGSVKAAGNSTEISSYSYRDKHISEAKGLMLYYRLKQVDFDGALSYSKILELQLHEHQASFLVIYPNPAKKTLFIKYNFSEQAIGDKKLRIYNTLGKEVYNVNLKATDRIGELSIPVSVWEKGYYYISIASEEQVEVHKALVK